MRINSCDGGSDGPCRDDLIVDRSLHEDEKDNGHQSSCCQNRVEDLQPEGVGEWADDQGKGDGPRPAAAT